VRRWAAIVLVLAIFLLGATAAQGLVRNVSLSDPVRVGDYASLTVEVSPRARCTIEVIYDKVRSKAKGLGPKTGGRITWRWRVGGNTRPGRWPIVVRCGKSGTLTLHITVRPLPTTALPGQKVDVGGYGLYLECAGSASPTIILEAGSAAVGGNFHEGDPGPGSATLRLEGWLTMRAALASETRVCAYDRAGLGASDPRPPGLAPTAATFADELRTLLTNANVPGPYVLYGGSFGGLLNSGYTLRHASDVVGLVFSDALGPGSAGLSGRSGLEAWDAGADLDGLLSLQFGNRPMAVLTSTFTGEAPDLIRRSSNSLWVDAPGTGHIIAAEAPQLVVEAVRLVVAAVRTNAKLPPCEQTRLPTLVPRGRCQSLGS